MLAALLSVLLAAADAAPPVSPGRFVLRGTGRLDARPLPAREERVETLALVGPGAAPDEVAVQLRSWGFSCDLRARLARDGSLRLAPGQTCRLPVEAEDARGEVEARLTRGAGRLDARELALDLAWELGGTLRTRLAVPGAEELAAWTPAVPVRGTAAGAARGTREASPR